MNDLDDFLQVPTLQTNEGTKTTMSEKKPTGPGKDANLALLQKYIQQLEVQGARTEDEGPKEHRYWDTQPVPRMDEPCDPSTHPEGAIEPDKQDVPDDPIRLPAGFVWSSVDILKDEELEEMYTLLYRNYVEDDDNMFRFNYSKDFLKWALMPPGWKKVWHLGIRNAKKGNLLAFISAIPAKISCKDNPVQMVEINFLCVHKKLRAKRVAPSLISEITRRVNKEGIFQAAYTAGTVIPRPIASCQYWHRPLDPKKLIDIRFSALRPKEKMKDVIKRYRVAQAPKHAFKPMEERHVEGAFELVASYLKKFKVAPVFDKEEFKHWLFPQERVIDTFVVENESGKVTDVCSFYTLPSTVMQHETHKELKAAYSYYNVATSMSVTELFQDMLVLAKQRKYDVFNALHIMENKDIFEECKFGPGDGNLQYYLYNYRLYPINPEEMGLVLL